MQGNAWRLKEQYFLTLMKISSLLDESDREMFHLESFHLESKKLQHSYYKAIFPFC